MDKDTLNLNMSADFSIFGDTSAFEHMIDLQHSSVIDCINTYIKYKIRDEKNGKHVYSSVFKHLRIIEETYNIILKPIVIGDVFWKQFQDYLTRTGMKSASINSMCSRIVSALKWSANYGAKISATLDNYAVEVAVEKPKVSLSQDDVSRITYVDIDSFDVPESTKDILKRVRDQFVLACFLGQRYSDVKRITPENFTGETFTIIQQKTGTKAVVDFKKMTVYPKVVRTILERYNYTAPFPRHISNYNARLKDLFRLAGFTQEVSHTYKLNGELHHVTYKFYELVSSHTARRTMITNAVQRGIHVEEIRRASGHTSEKAFSKYVCWND